MTDEAIEQRSFSDNTKTIVLIIFSVICWGILWDELWNLSYKIINWSPAGLYLDLAFLMKAPPEKREIMTEALKRGLSGDLYWPHLFIIVGNIVLLPVIVGFYIGRHSVKNKYFNCFLTLFFVNLFGPSFKFFSDFDIGAFF